MKQLIIGLVAGCVVGAGGTYLALRWPGSAAPPVVAAADAGAGTVAPPGRRRRGGKRRRHVRHYAATTPRPGDDEVAEPEPPLADEPPPPELSAADREVAWRGPAIATPTRRVDLTRTSQREARTLNQEEIDRGIRSNAAAVSACIRGARGAAPLSGTVTLELLVQGNGHATRSRVRAPRYLLDHGLLACTQRAVRGMRFAATGAPTIVTVPFEVR